MSTKTARRNKSAARSRKATSNARAKRAAASPPPVPNLAPNAVVIPSNDPLVGAQFNANVNCKTHKITKGKRKGKSVRRCDRQRLTVVGGATPSSDHPKRKQLFAVQTGSRFTIPDREIRRDLRDAGRVRDGESCDTYRERLVEGRSVPERAYDACPGLDAVEPRSGGDTSFEFKENGRKPAFALVSSRGLDDIVVSPHSTRESAEAAMRRKGFDPTAHPSFHGGYRVADLSGYDIIEPFGQKMLRPKRNGAGVTPPFGPRGTPVEVVGGYLAQWGVRPLLRDLGGGRVLVMPSRENTAAGFGATELMRALSYKRHGNHEIRVEPYPSTTGGRVVVQVTLVPASQLLAETRAHEKFHRQLKRAMPKRNHHGGYHAPGDPLGVYLAKPNRAPRGAVPGQTYADKRADDLTGRRVSGDRYAGEVRGRAVGCDGKTASHIVGGHIVPRSRVASSVRRESMEMDRQMDRQIRDAAFASRYGFNAPQSVPVYDADEGLARMAEIEAAPAPFQLGHGPSFGAGEMEPVRAIPKEVSSFRKVEASRIEHAVQRVTSSRVALTAEEIDDALMREAADAIRALRNPRVAMSDASANLLAHGIVRRIEARLAAAAPPPMPFSQRFGAGSAEELRPRSSPTPAAISDADLAAMFMEEAAKLGLVKQNRRRHAARR